MMKTMFCYAMINKFAAPPHSKFFLNSYWLMMSVPIYKTPLSFVRDETMKDELPPPLSYRSDYNFLH